jgi:hypothetical protein
VLTRDQSCIRSLAWSVGLPRATDLAGLLPGLEGRGFSLHRRVGALCVLRDGRENEVAVVLSTRRVQIRVCYLLPVAERRPMAERLYRQILEALQLVPAARR